MSIPALRLEDGDSVVVDSIPALADLLHVTIAGMVQKPGRYEWRPGMTLRELVTLARGPTVGADLREAEVSRLPVDRTSGELSRTIRVPLDSTYLLGRDSAGNYHGAAGLPFPAAGSAPETELRPFDQITIFRQPEFELQRAVKIFGEVAYPGTYALTHKEERLSGLVERAGGLTQTAFAGGARFFREFEDAGQVNIDLSRALARTGRGDDVILQPGDSIFVPEYITTVRVQGAVLNPTSVLYQPGAGIDFYVGNAGGYSRNADEGRVSVRYANGDARVRDKFLFFGTNPRPGPGSVISVPAKPEAEPVNVTQLLGTISQLMASLVAIVAIASR